jgi:hypothetical protein
MFVFMIEVSKKSRQSVEIEMSRLSNGIAVISLTCLAGKALVQHRGRQEFEVADLKLAAFIDEHNFEVEVGIEILTLF